MNTQLSSPRFAASRPAVTLLMILCGIAGVAGAGAVGAATSEDAVPRHVVKYNPQALDTDKGAKAVYRRLVMAAEEVCPQSPSGSLMVNGAVEQCREQAVARAVREINNPRLAAIGGSREKTS